MKFLRRYLDEKEPTLKNFAKVVRRLEERGDQPRRCHLGIAGD
jgi:hypothetical protein